MHPQSENERNGKAAQRNERHLRRGKKSGEDETKRRRGKQTAQGGPPAGQRGDCSSVGRWEAAPQPTSGK